MGMMIMQDDDDKNDDDKNDDDGDISSVAGFIS